VAWQHTDVSGASYRETDSTGAVAILKSSELDPMGRDAGVRSPFSNPHPRMPVEYKTYPGFSDGTTGICTLDGVTVPCAIGISMANSHAAFLKPGSEPEPGQPLGIGPGAPIWIPDYDDTSGDWWDPATNTLHGVTNGHFEFGANMGIATQVTKRDSGKAPLTAIQRKRYETIRARARKMLNGRCIDFLVGSGFSITDVLHALDWQKPYDGFRSTVSVIDAGLNPPPPVEYANVHVRSTPVQEGFIWNRGNLSARTAIYKESTRFDVYLNTDEMSSAFYSSTTLIHEALHSATMMDDLKLAKKITGRDFPDTEKGYYDAGEAISRRLADEGCGWRMPGN
jgi:hypothetical protein